jgi:hypothetical protein
MSKVTSDHLRVSRTGTWRYWNISNLLRLTDSPLGQKARRRLQSVKGAECVLGICRQTHARPVQLGGQGYTTMN